MTDVKIVNEKKSKRVGCLRWLGRVALGGVILLLVLAAAGAIFQSVASARDTELYKPVNQMVDVDDIQMRLDCRGSGSPTVVLEAGAQSSGIYDTAPVLHRHCIFSIPPLVCKIDEHDSIIHDNSCQRDKSKHSHDTKGIPGNNQSQHSANECKRYGCQDD